MGLPSLDPKQPRRRSGKPLPLCLSPEHIFFPLLGKKMCSGDKQRGSSGSEVAGKTSASKTPRKTRNGTN